MFKKAILFTVFSLFAMSAFASFPVNKKNVEKSIEKVETIAVETIESTTMQAPLIITDAESALSPAAAGSSDDAFVITILLWFFLGGLAAHRWYAGKPAGWNILFILTLGGLGIWWIVDGINILTGNF